MLPWARLLNVLAVPAIGLGAAPVQFHTIRQQDVEDVVRQTLSIARKMPQYQHHCLISRVARPVVGIAGTTDEYRGIIYRWLPAPSIAGNLPEAWTGGWQTVADEFGCADTLEIEQPIFGEERELHAPSRLTASVGVNSLCGPICGEERATRFVRRNGHWMQDGKPMEPTGKMY